MVVLVVDDQTNVVSGIVFGVDWKRIGVEKVLKAYNAFEAKEILQAQEIDILLCDIEMPVESGLDLLRWIKGQQMDVECIFLTAHADFVYAKEAIQLGSFDYILQPVRYQEIEEAIIRAWQKIQMRREMQKYYSYGKMLYHEKDRFVDALLRDWYTSKQIDEAALLEDFGRFGILIKSTSRLYFVLLCITKWMTGGESWDEGLLKLALNNIASELFSRYGQKVLLSQIGRNEFGFIIYSEDQFMIDEQGVVRQLDTLINVFNRHMGCSMACYTGDSLIPGEVPGRVRELVRMRDDNVSLTSRVFFLGQESKTTESIEAFQKMKWWGSMLINHRASNVYEEAEAYLNKLAATGKLSGGVLKRFYQEFIQMTAAVFEQIGCSINEIFVDSEISDKVLRPYGSIDDMKAFIRSVTDYFNEAPGDIGNVKNQVKQIIHYIRENVDKDIRRSDLAEAVFLNPSYISRLFKNETGYSLKKFITQEKMSMAQALLRTTELPISMVAAKVGYYNFSHFSQTYKNHMGVTPAEDRRK